MSKTIFKRGTAFMLSAIMALSGISVPAPKARAEDAGNESAIYFAEIELPDEGRLDGKAGFSDTLETLWGAEAGSEVPLMVVPDEGFYLDDLYAYTADPEADYQEYVIHDNGGYAYSLIMPAEDVIVRAVFTAEDEHPGEEEEDEAKSPENGDDEELQDAEDSEEVAEDVFENEEDPEDAELDAAWGEGEDEEILEEIPAVEEAPANILKADNAWQEPEKKDLFTATFTREEDFPEASFGWVEILEGSELENTVQSLAAFLSDYDADIVLPLWIGVLDRNGDEREDLGEVKIRLDMKDIDRLEETALYHLKQDGEWEELPYKSVDEDDEMYTEFIVKSFSPFLFVQLSEKEVEPEAQAVPEEVEPEEIELEEAEMSDLEIDEDFMVEDEMENEPVVEDVVIDEQEEEPIEDVDLEASNIPEDEQEEEPVAEVQEEEPEEITEAEEPIAEIEPEEDEDDQAEGTPMDDIDLQASDRPMTQEEAMEYLRSISLSASADATLTYPEVVVEDYTCDEMGVNGNTPKIRVSFEYDGVSISEDAYCASPEAYYVPDNPNYGMEGTIKKHATTNIMTKILYFGRDDFSGNKSFWKDSDSAGYEYRNASAKLKWNVVHTAVSIANKGPSPYANMYTDAGKELSKALYDYADSHEIPTVPIYFYVSKNKKSLGLKASFVGEGADRIQKTPTVTFKGSSDNYITMPIPEDVTIHITRATGNTVKKKGSADVKIYGGDVFYFTAPADYGASHPLNWASGTLKGHNTTVYNAYTIEYPKLGGKMVQDISLVTATPDEDNVDIGIKWKQGGTLPVSIKKTTAPGFENIVDDNPLYSLEGCKYEVYKSRDDARQRRDSIGEFILNADGECENDLELDYTYQDKTVFVVETVAGKGYLVNPEIYESDPLTTNGTTIEVEDIPLYSSFKLEKVNAADPDEEPPAWMSPAGIIFKVSFYAASNANGSPAAVWYFETKEEVGTDNKRHYVVRLADSYLSSSTIDPFYRDNNNQPVLPLGTVVIEEIATEGSSYALQNMYWDLHLVDHLETEAPGTSVTVFLTEDTDTGNNKQVRARTSVGVLDTLELGEEFEVTAVDWPKYGALHIDKYATDRNRPLAGAQFILKNQQTGATWKPETDKVALCGDADANGLITVRNDGKADVYYIPTDPTLPEGTTYVLEEVYAPVGYAVNNVDNLVVLTPGAMANKIVIDEKYFGGITLYKQDAKTRQRVPQGDGTLEGAQFTITNVSGKEIELQDGTKIANNAVVMTITTDSTGMATTGLVLPYGDYTVQETRKSNAGYRLVTETKPVKIDAGTQTVVNTTIPATELNILEPSIEVSVKIKKTNESDQIDPDLAGIKFAVINRSVNAVLYKNVSYNPGQVIAILTTGANGESALEENVPYGTYQAVELREDATIAVGDVYNTAITTKGGNSPYANASHEYLFKPNTDQKKMEEDGKTYEFTFKDERAKGGIEINKKFVENNASDGHADAKLTGIRFAVVNNVKDVAVNGATYTKGQVIMIMTLDENGHAATANNVFPLGSYTVYELRKDAQIEVGMDYATAGNALGTSPLANDLGTLFTNYSDTKQISHHEEMAPYTPTNPTTTHKVALKKSDAETEEAQGDADLSGIRFAVINRSAKAAVVGNTTYEPGQVIAVVQTNNEGTMSTAMADLPYGTYQMVELKADATIDTGDDYDNVIENKGGNSPYANPSHSYLYQDNSDQKKLEVNGQTYEFTFTDVPVRGGIHIYKADYDTNGYTAQGDADLAGIRFAIVNKSAKPVMVNGQKYAVGAVVAIISTDENGEAKTNNDTLPYGTYDVIELRANATLKAGDIYAEADAEKLGNSQYANYVGNQEANDSNHSSMKYSDYTETVTIRNNGEMVGEEESDAAYNNGETRLHLEDEVVRGGVHLYKADYDTNGYTAQGDAILSGIRFAIVNKSLEPVVVDGTLYAPGAVVAILTTDENGEAMTSNEALPYGSYEAIELRLDADVEVGDMFDSLTEAELGTSIYANGTGNMAEADNAEYPSMRFADMREPFSIRYEHEMAGAGTRDDAEGNEETFDDERVHFENAVTRGGASLKKADAETSEYVAQGDISLAGIRFAIVNRSAGSVYVNGTLYAPDEVVMILTTDEHGEAATTANDQLPYGTYEAIELRADATIDLGDVYNDETPEEKLGTSIYANTHGTPEEETAGFGSMLFGNQRATETIRAEGDVMEFDFEDEPVRGGVSINKYDIESRQSHPQGSATLEGATFAIYNRSVSFILVDADGDGTPEQRVEPDELAMTIVTDENGNAQTADNSLPYGSYEIIETDSPEGYLEPSEYPDGVYAQSFKIREHGVIVDMTDYDHSIVDHVIRNDFSLRKVASSGQGRMGNIPFRVTSRTTGESHIIMTDVNGLYDSSKIKHSVNTNGGDDTNGDPTAGLWFGLDADGNNVPVDDNVGALPYDTYLIEELECEANAGMTMWRDEFTVYEDIDYQGGVIIELNNIENVKKPSLGTKASVDGAQVVLADGTVTITDVVTWARLKEDQLYTLKATLMTSDGDPVKDAEGNDVFATKTFTCPTEYGNTSIDITFDASEMAGISVVVFEEAFEGETTEGTPVAEHKDLNDQDQTIKFVGIRTQAVDASTGTNMMLAEKDAQIIDTVLLTNVDPGRSYTLFGTMHDKETGLELTDANGRPITGKASFIAPDSDCSVQVIFNFDGSNLGGVTMVAFEDLYQGTKHLASHADITDEAQTIYVPDAKTEAHDAVTKENIILPGQEISIEDDVHYSNLIPLKTYTVEGILMNKETGKEILDIDGNIVTATREFTPGEGETEGTVTMTFTFTASLSGVVAVAFETIEYEGVPVAVHAELTDEDQTVYFPEIRTTAVDEESGEKTLTLSEETVINDIVEYSAVVDNKTYTLKAVLMDKETESELLVDGKPVVSTVTFSVGEDEHSGTVTVPFTINTKDAAGKDIVVFETLYMGEAPEEGDKPLAEHKVITDEGQTVHVPEIGTKAIDKETGTNIARAVKDLTIIDTVSFSHVTPGLEYTFKAVLMDKETKEPVKDADGEIVTGTATITPDEAEGSVEVPFTFDATNLAGGIYVAFEEMYYKDYLVAVHQDYEDEDQTIYIPELKTEAKDAVTERHYIGSELKDISIKDTVYFKGLAPKKTYKFSGVLVDKATGDPLKDEDGKEITSEQEYTPDKPDGSVVITFNFKASLHGIEAVAYETVTYEGIEVAVHANIEDEDQTVRFPEIRTSAKDSETGIHSTLVQDEATIIDTVTFKGLKAHDTFTMRGYIVDRDTEKPLLIDGKMVTAEVVFEADDKDGTVEMEFVFPTTDQAGKHLVVFESLYEGDITGEEIPADGDDKHTPIAVHKDLTDKNQTITVTDLATSAKDGVTGLNEGVASKEATIIDTVYFNGLTIGQEYTVKGVVMLKPVDENEEAKPLKNADGEEVTAEITFVADAESGSKNLEFKFDASLLNGRTVVVFERMLTEGVEIAVHADINDADQSISYPDLKTTAKDAVNGTKNLTPSKTAKLADVVAYSNVTPGVTYTLVAKVVYKDSGEPVTLANGKEVTATHEFTPANADGTEEVIIDLDSTLLVGKALVAFETLMRDGKEVAIHADLKDEDQTVYVPEIKTTALDKATGEHVGKREKTTTIVDTVAYTGLIPNTKYGLTGTLWDKTNDKELLINGKPVTKSIDFTPEKSEGTVVLEFTFDATVLTTSAVVAFETVTYEGKEVAVHADIKDEDQTVNYPEIKTNATDVETKTHVSNADKEVQIQDTVTYSGLIPNKKHVMNGTLTDKITGKPLQDASGKDITATVTFEPKKPDGSVTLTFKFDGSILAGRTAVVFESLLYEGKEIAVHADVKDEDQTIYFPEIKTSAKDAADGDKEVSGSGEVKITDSVSYNNVVVGRDYKVVGTLMDKASKAPVKIDGKEVTAEATFHADKTSGTVDVTFTFDISKYDGEVLVVFEKLFDVDTGKEIAIHENFEDEAQTIKVTKPEGTPGTDSSSPGVGNPQTGLEDYYWAFVAIGVGALAGIFFFVWRKKKQNGKGEN